MNRLRAGVVGARDRARGRAAAIDRDVASACRAGDPARHAHRAHNRPVAARAGPAAHEDAASRRAGAARGQAAGAARARVRRPADGRHARVPSEEAARARSAAGRGNAAGSGPAGSRRPAARTPVRRPAASVAGRPRRRRRTAGRRRSRRRCRPRRRGSVEAPPRRQTRRPHRHPDASAPPSPPSPPGGPAGGRGTARAAGRSARAIAAGSRRCRHEGDAAAPAECVAERRQTRAIHAARRPGQRCQDSQRRYGEPRACVHSSQFLERAPPRQTGGLRRARGRPCR